MRRFEALTGSAAYQQVVAMRRQLESAAETLRTGVENVGPALAALMQRSRDQEERLGAFEDKYRSDAGSGLAEGAERVGEHALVVAAVPGATNEDLRLLALAARERIKDGVVMLGSERDGKAQLVAVLSRSLVARGLSARDLIKHPAELVGGGGGGDAEVAQAGGPGGGALEEALAEAGTEIRAQLAAL